MQRGNETSPEGSLFRYQSDVDDKKTLYRTSFTFALGYSDTSNHWVDTSTRVSIFR